MSGGNMRQAKEGFQIYHQILGPYIKNGVDSKIGRDIVDINIGANMPK